jgi:hypothetical protein
MAIVPGIVLLRFGASPDASTSLLDPGIENMYIQSPWLWHIMTINWHGLITTLAGNPRILSSCQISNGGHFNGHV